VRLDRDGDVWVRASSHGHYQGCKWAFCRHRWFASSGWTRVSRGSHAGHVPAQPMPGGGRPRGLGSGAVRFRPLIPGRDLRERTTTAEGLRLVPLETLDKRGYRRLDHRISPPWEKRVYGDPESDSS